MKKIMAVVLGILVSAALLAAPKKKECNDLKVDRCKDRTDCVWIKAHKTKDGKLVKAHCKCKGTCE
jgi:hypothetical protein